jgi:hypothetical protein
MPGGSLNPYATISEYATISMSEPLFNWQRNLTSIPDKTATNQSKNNLYYYMAPLLLKGTLVPGEPILSIANDLFFLFQSRDGNLRAGTSVLKLFRRE